MHKPLVSSRICELCDKPFVPGLTGGVRYHHGCAVEARRQYQKRYWHLRNGRGGRTHCRNIDLEYDWNYACPVCGMKHPTDQKAYKCCEGDVRQKAYKCCEGDVRSDREPYYQEGGFWYLTGDPRLLLMPKNEVTISSLRIRCTGTSCSAPAVDSSDSTQPSSVG